MVRALNLQGPGETASKALSFTAAFRSLTWWTGLFGLRAAFWHRWQNLARGQLDGRTLARWQAPVPKWSQRFSLAKSMRPTMRCHLLQHHGPDRSRIWAVWPPNPPIRSFLCGQTGAALANEGWCSGGLAIQPCDGLARYEATDLVCGCSCAPGSH